VSEGRTQQTCACMRLHAVHACTQVAVVWHVLALRWLKRLPHAVAPKEWVFLCASQLSRLVCLLLPQVHFGPWRPHQRIHSSRRHKLPGE
jgi:hypothetical protein